MRLGFINLEVSCEEMGPQVGGLDLDGKPASHENNGQFHIS